MKPKAHAHSASPSLRSECPADSPSLSTGTASVPASYRYGHSALVEMELRIDDKVFRVAQLGPEFIILHEPADHPPATGEMMLRVDGHERRWQVHLPEGMSSKVTHVRTATVSPDNLGGFDE